MPGKEGQQPMNADQLARMTRCLVDGATVEDIVHATDLTRQTVSNQLHAMQAAGAAYIRRWAQDKAGRRTKAVWAVGNRPNASRPTGQTAAMRQRAYRKRKKAQAQAMA